MSCIVVVTMSVAFAKMYVDVGVTIKLPLLDAITVSTVANNTIAKTLFIFYTSDLFLLKIP